MTPPLTHNQPRRGVPAEIPPRTQPRGGNNPWLAGQSGSDTARIAQDGRRAAYLPPKSAGTMVVASTSDDACRRAPILHSPASGSPVNAVCLPFPLDGCRVRFPGGAFPLTPAEGYVCRGAAVIIPDFSTVEETGRFIPRWLPTGYRKQYAAKTVGLFFGERLAFSGRSLFFLGIF